jgi:hypothetical protein
VLHRAAVVLDLVRDAIDDDAVARRLVHLRAAELHHLAGDAVRCAELVDALHERWRKAVFAPAKEPDDRWCALLLHDAFAL